MKRAYRLILTFALFFSAFISNQILGQQAFPKIALPDTSLSLMIKANAKIEDEKYGDALEILNKISDGDSNYVTTCYYKYLAYFNQKKYASAIKQLDNIKNENNTYGASLITMYSSAYRDSGAFDKAFKIINDGISKYPLYAPLRYYMALIYLEQKKYDEFHNEIIECIKINPRYSTPHYHLAKINGLMNLKSKALLGFSYYILIENSKTNVLDAIGMMEKISENNFAKIDAIKMQNNTLTSYYEELDDLISPAAASVPLVV